MSGVRSIGSVLVANRGEIALRVIRSCRARGVRSVAVYTEPDRTAPHVREADEAVLVGSYLDGAALVAAARRAGADAVHPGYGFLSESGGFARAVQAAGLVFVGPPADAIDTMGRKDAARRVAVAAGVPVVPVRQAPDLSAPVTPADGFPLLVKAAAGGGGKGMRIVRTPAEYDAALAAARREAMAAFGDDTMLLEKYVEHGRHIEVQVVADTHGNVRHLFERDCSPQRRHQKVLEEAPAPTITPEVRALVTSAAVALARQVGYVNAGTVEFLLDAESGEAFFLEMNTRLQVEHPVTEQVVRVAGTPLDLVGLQLDVAAGRPLPFAQDQVTIAGHAIEARVYAEDPYHGFLPQAGRATLVRWPTHARVDAALESGQVVGTSYDPMLGKVVAHGIDREAARRVLVAALDDTAILGLTTNTGFLRALVASEEFQRAAIDTAWLDSAELPAPDDDLARVFAAWADVRARAGSASAGDPFRPDGWRQGAPAAATAVELDRIVNVRRATGDVDGVPVRELFAAGHELILEVAGTCHRAVAAATAHHVEVVLRGHRHVFARPDVFADTEAAGGDGTILAPMPGTMLAVAVAAGQPVAEGAQLGVLEAMKMELALTAPFAGTVTAVDVAPGAQVALGTRLFVVEPAAGGVDRDGRPA